MKASNLARKPKTRAAAEKAHRALVASRVPGTVQLTQWAVVLSSENPFTAPEATPIRLSGFAHGHPGFKDGDTVTTSPVVAANGRRITTESGRVYELIGEPPLAYLDHLAKIGHVYNPEQPIVIKGRAAPQASS